MKLNDACSNSYKHTLNTLARTFSNSLRDKVTCKIFRTSAAKTLEGRNRDNGIVQEAKMIEGEDRDVLYLYSYDSGKVLGDDNSLYTSSKDEPVPVTKGKQKMG